MPPRSLVCDTCGRTLGQLEYIFDRHVKRSKLLKTGRHLVRIEWRLLAGRWAEVTR